MAINTVGELIDALQEYDRAAPVQLAIQPGHPFAHSVGTVVAAEVYDGSGADREVVYIGDGGQLDYLNGEACEVLGW